MLELSLHTTNHRPSQPAIRQNASDRMCRRSLGCIPGVASQDLGRSDFAIPLPGLRQRGEVGSRSRGHPTNGAPRDAPEPDSQFQRTDAGPAPRGRPASSATAETPPIGGGPGRGRIPCLLCDKPHSTFPAAPGAGKGMEVNGFEPMTPCLQSRCSPSLATPPPEIGGPGRI